jgi:hypothetical protein
MNRRRTWVVSGVVLSVVAVAVFIMWRQSQEVWVRMVPEGASNGQELYMDYGGGFLPEYGYVCKAQCTKGAFDSYVQSRGYVRMTGDQSPVSEERFPQRSELPWWQPSDSTLDAYVKAPDTCPDGISYVKHESGTFYYAYYQISGQSECWVPRTKRGR